VSAKPPAEFQLESHVRIRGLEFIAHQEIWGHLCCHYAIRTLMADAAQHTGHDPDRVSFIAALRIARQSVAPRGAFPPEDHSATQHVWLTALRRLASPTQPSTTAP